LIEKTGNPGRGWLMGWLMVVEEQLMGQKSS
jgi:hypothetical protein